MKILTFLIMLIVIYSSPVNASANAKDIDKEIKLLLSFVETTNCIFERNGTMYSGRKALKHIYKKYEYYENKINSAETFIKYTASKSKMSGKPYKIHCKGEPTITSKNWFLTELKEIRNKN